MTARDYTTDRERQSRAHELRELGYAWDTIAERCGYASAGAAYRAAMKAKARG